MTNAFDDGNRSTACSGFSLITNQLHCNGINQLWPDPMEMNEWCKALPQFFKKKVRLDPVRRIIAAQVKTENVRSKHFPGFNCVICLAHVRDWL